MKDLAINGNGHKTRKLIELENALVEAQKKITALETTNEALRKHIAELESNQNTMHKSILDLTEDVAKIKTKLRIKETVKID